LVVGVGGGAIKLWQEAPTEAGLASPEPCEQASSLHGAPPDPRLLWRQPLSRAGRCL